jgi:OOP family OmpA-OmpF porin
MNQLVRTACFIALLPLVGACTLALHVPSMQTMSPTGPPFTQGLANGYRDLSQEQAKEYDWTVAELFARKSLHAAHGEDVQPEVAENWRWRLGGNPIEPMLPELADVRTRLLAKLDGGARERMPVEASAAQVAYDCWVEEASEPDSADDLAKCRGTVLAFLAVTATMTQTTSAAKAAEVMPEVYLVFFAFDKSDISPVAAQVLDRVVDDFHRTGSTRLDTQGYTDLSGSVEYNQKLSERRAEAVKRYLLAHGVQESQIQTEWFGKTHPRVATPDGVRNQENRRAEIYLKK